MSVLADILILKLAGRITKLLVEAYFGRGARSAITGEGVDVLTNRIQSVADRKKAQRDFEDMGDRMAKELLPLFEAAQRRGYLNAEAVVLALENTLASQISAWTLVDKDLDAGALLARLRNERPLPLAQYSEAETELYESALERTVRQLIGIASRLPQFEEASAARSLQQLSRIVSNMDEILAAVRRIEDTVGAKVTDRKAREYEVEYRLAVYRNLDYVEIFGIDLPPEARSQRLSVSYVSLNLASSSKGGSEVLPAEALFARLSPENGRILIRGDAGSGKSTLLRWAAMTAARGLEATEVDWRDLHYLRESRRVISSLGMLKKQLRRRKVTAVPSIDDELAASPKDWQLGVPFLIRLRHCRMGSLPSPEVFPELVAQEVGTPPADWVRSILREGRGLILLDGVDEIPNTHRDATRRQIEALVRQYPSNRFVVSTRPKAVEEGWLIESGFREARINPMSDLDRNLFIDRWHHAIAERLVALGRSSADLPEIAAALKRELDENVEVARLATNPLLCALICSLHRDRNQKLPERQRQLCEALCEALLHRRERESGLDLVEFPEAYRRLDYPQKRAAVQNLAQHMVIEGYSVVAVEEARQQIRGALAQFSGHSESDARDVTDSLVERSGLLREESPGQISFVHNAFKELLAGDYFADKYYARLLAQHFLEPEWQPVILFAVAADRRGFATKVISSILEAGSGMSRMEQRKASLLALRCRAAALYLDKNVDARLGQIAKDMFPPRNMEDAEALASSGNAAVPFLRFREDLRDDEATASIRTLRLIGTPQARQALYDYREDRRADVILELSQAVNPLEIRNIQDRLLNGEVLPIGIRRQITDIYPLARLTDLRTLYLSATQVEDLTPLQNLASLEVLDLSFTPVVDISSLRELRNLRLLNLKSTRVENIGSLGELTNLQLLNLRETRVTDISPIKKLANLTELYLADTGVTDFSPADGRQGLRVIR